MKITEEAGKDAAEHGLAEDEALKKPLEARSKPLPKKLADADLRPKAKI